MKKLFSAMLLCLLAASPAVAAERNFVVASFDTIRVEGGVRVELTTDSSPSAVAISEDRATLDRVRLRNNGRTLNVSVQRKAHTSRDFIEPSPVIVRLSTYRIGEAYLTGGGVLDIDRMEERETRLMLIGGGSLSVADLDTQELEIDIRGTGKVAIGGGKALEADVVIDGAGALEAAGFETRRLSLIHQGPGTTRIGVTELAELTNLGAGTIEILGGAKCELRTVGVGSVSCPDDTPDY